MSDRRRDTLPGFPRARLPSRPHADDPEPHIPEAVFHALQSMSGKIEETNLKVATLADTVTKLVASGRTETAKIIAGVVIAALGVIGGQRALAPSPSPAPVPIVRSALDIRLDVCRPMAPGPSREDCFARTVAETDH